MYIEDMIINKEEINETALFMEKIYEYYFNNPPESGFDGSPEGQLRQVWNPIIKDVKKIFKKYKLATPALKRGFFDYMKQQFEYLDD